MCVCDSQVCELGKRASVPSYRSAAYGYTERFFCIACRGRALALLYASYFCTIVAFGGTYWSVDLLTGCVLTAGSIGFLMRYLVADTQSA